VTALGDESPSPSRGGKRGVKGDLRCCVLNSGKEKQRAARRNLKKLRHGGGCQKVGRRGREEHPEGGVFRLTAPQKPSVECNGGAGGGPFADPRPGKRGAGRGEKIKAGSPVRLSSGRGGATGGEEGMAEGFVGRGRRGEKRR